MAFGLARRLPLSYAPASRSVRCAPVTCSRWPSRRLLWRWVHRGRTAVRAGYGTGWIPLVSRRGPHRGLRVGCPMSRSWPGAPCGSVRSGRPCAMHLIGLPGGLYPFAPAWRCAAGCARDGVAGSSIEVVIACRVSDSTPCGAGAAMRAGTRNGRTRSVAPFVMIALVHWLRVRYVACCCARWLRRGIPFSVGSAPSTVGG